MKQNWSNELLVKVSEIHLNVQGSLDPFKVTVIGDDTKLTLPRDFFIMSGIYNTKWVHFLKVRV